MVGELVVLGVVVGWGRGAGGVLVGGGGGGVLRRRGRLPWLEQVLWVFEGAVDTAPFGRGPLHLHVVLRVHGNIVFIQQLDVTVGTGSRGHGLPQPRHGCHVALRAQVFGQVAVDPEGDVTVVTPEGAGVVTGGRAVLLVHVLFGGVHLRPLVFGEMCFGSEGQGAGVTAVGALDVVNVLVVGVLRVLGKDLVTEGTHVLAVLQ